jgi:hypothetical protein
VARSGSITENIVDAGGFKKVVLELQAVPMIQKRLPAALQVMKLPRNRRRTISPAKERGSYEQQEEAEAEEEEGWSR